MLKTYNPVPFLLEYHEQRKVMNDCMISYERNRYSVPYQYVGSYIGVRDLKNGILELYDSAGKCIAKHEKILGRHKSSTHKKHFEQMASSQEVI